MAITLCFDFGNTRKKCGVFDKRELREVVVLENGSVEEIEELVKRFQPDRSVLSSVVKHDPEIERILSATSHFHKVNHHSALTVTTPVGKPDTIGADRLALCMAAVDLFPGGNNLVIGLGTCITYNFINIHAEFLGGAISPGMEMRFRSMHEYTALLPLVQKDWNFPLLGYDTRTNILSGVILGMAKEIDGMIDAYSERYSNFNVLLTGGDAPYFVPHLKNKIFADPDLIFRGLLMISEHNYA